MPYHVPLAALLPVIGAGVLLVIYCLVDIARTERPLLVRKWQWMLAVVLLVPIGPLAYLLFEKLGVTAQPGTEQPSHAGDDFSMRDR